MQFVNRTLHCCVCVGHTLGKFTFVCLVVNVNIKLCNIIKIFCFINVFVIVRYLTYTEWTTLYGGKRTGPETSTFRRLPFDHCCLCLQPFEHPYCDKQGNIFELQAVVAYLKKFKSNPVTGEVGCKSCLRNA
jgi:hypothetical protein